jgi:hypothetical protein
MRLITEEERGVELVSFEISYLRNLHCPFKVISLTPKKAENSPAQDVHQRVLNDYRGPGFLAIA